MRQTELVDRVRSYDPDADENVLNRAYVFAMQAHGPQKRASGDPYFSHPLEVAGILTDLKLDSATIVTALLHDTVEDTTTTIEEVDRNFGGEIAATLFDESPKYLLIFIVACVLVTGLLLLTFIKNFEKMGRKMRLLFKYWFKK